MQDAITRELPASAPVPGTTGSGIQRLRRRRISPRAGRALEILSHAIEYLTDEYVHAGGELCSQDPQIQAIQLLMAVNRQVYLECPELPTLSERCLAWLRERAA